MFAILKKKIKPSLQPAIILLILYKTDKYYLVQIRTIFTEELLIFFTIFQLLEEIAKCSKMCLEFLYLLTKYLSTCHKNGCCIKFNVEMKIFIYNYFT